MPFVKQQDGIHITELKSIRKEASSIVLLIGDIHFRDRPPSSCTESYLDDLLDMLEYTSKIANLLKADVVLAGDVFDQKLPSRTSHSTILRILSVLKKFDRIPYGVVGNHDISSDVHSSTYEKQPLGVLFESGWLEELNGWAGDIPVFGVPWQQRWQHEDAPWEALEGWRAGVHDHDLSKSLVVTHAPIYPLGQELEFEFVPTAGEHGLSKAMDHTGYLYYGHIHEPHSIFEVEGTTYANFGSLSRGSLTEANINRKVQIGLWTPEHGFKPLDIPHKPAAEVFRMTEVQAKRDEKLSLDSFLSQVGSSTLEISSSAAFKQHIQELDHIDLPVRTRAIDYIEEAE